MRKPVSCIRTWNARRWHRSLGCRKGCLHRRERPFTPALLVTISPSFSKTLARGRMRWRARPTHGVTVLTRMLSRMHFSRTRASDG